MPNAIAVADVMLRLPSPAHMRGHFLRLLSDEAVFSQQQPFLQAESSAMGGGATILGRHLLLLSGMNIFDRWNHD